MSNKGFEEEQILLRQEEARLRREHFQEMYEAPPLHIGDGVYVSFDGFHLMLGTNSATHPDNIVALEDTTYNALVEYAKKLWGWEPK